MKPQLADQVALYVMVQSQLEAIFYGVSSAVDLINRVEASRLQNSPRSPGRLVRQDANEELGPCTSALTMPDVDKARTWQEYAAGRLHRADGLTDPKRREFPASLNPHVPLRTQPTREMLLDLTLHTLPIFYIPLQEYLAPCSLRCISRRNTK
ncbi:hypothetical protein VTI28DRAFT_6427 [Corynascus sepedonium]